MRRPSTNGWGTVARIAAGRQSPAGERPDSRVRARGLVANLFRKHGDKPPGRKSHASTLSGVACASRDLHPLRVSDVTKLYVGNLPFSATEDSLRALFAAHGAVESLSLVMDRETGKPRGFGFIEMSSADAAKAMQALNGADFG